MPSAVQTTLKQPQRRYFEEDLFFLFPVFFIAFCAWLPFIYFPIYLIISFLLYWTARVIYVERKWGSFYREVPHLPTTRLAGHLGVFQPDELIHKLKEVFDEVGPISGVWLPPGWSPQCSIVDPDCLRIIMSTHNTPKGSIMKFFEEGTSLLDAIGSGWLGIGLLTANGDLWKSRRDLITPSFHFQILQNYMHIFASRSKTLADRMLKLSRTDGIEQSVNIFPLCTDCTLDIIGACAFGQDLGCQTQPEPSHYVQAIREISDLVFLRTFSAVARNRFIYALTPEGRRFGQLVKIIHQLPDRLIRERRAYLKDHQEEVEGKRRLDFLDMLLTVRDENGEPLSELAIRNEVDTFLFEGHDTTAAGLAWTLYCLAAHPEWQKKARDEVDAVLGPNRDEPTWDEAKSRFEVLESIVKESLRLYPPVPFIVRNSDVDLNLKGYHIPKDTELMLQIYHMHRRADYWKDPESFRPERFQEDGIKHPFAYIPFSAGHRSCIGQVFAMLEEKTILVTLLKKFEFVLDTSVPVEITAHVILRPKNGINLFIRPR